jgi:uncharacterized protein with PIN domain
MTLSNPSKYRKAPSGEWLGYPALTMEDIQQESFQFHKHVAESLIENRKGRIVLRMDQELYQNFLKIVKKKFGNISASDIEKAVIEMIKKWIEEEEKNQ